MGRRHCCNTLWRRVVACVWRLGVLMPVCCQTACDGVWDAEAVQDVFEAVGAAAPAGRKCPVKIDSEIVPAVTSSRATPRAGFDSHPPRADVAVLVTHVVDVVFTEDVGY